jgi:sigma-B regulation protein RsbU (phosphoserine phosphatase)
VKKSTDVLRRVLGALSDEDIAELNRVAVRRRYPSDTVICKEGEMEHTFYVIESGLVTVTERMADGRERMLGTKRDGEFFGEMGLLEDVPRAATVRTLTDSVLIEISEETFDAIVQRNPAVADTLLKGMSRALRDSNRLTIAELQLKNYELAKALKDLKAAQAELLRQERLKRELEIASAVQRSILPTEFPEVSGFDFAIAARSAREVGGDFYDVMELKDGHYGLVVADVSGKSWSAAMFMAIVRALLSREALESLSPATTLHRLHRQVLRTSTADMFVTIFYAIINEKNNKLCYVRAGHDRPILYQAFDKSLQFLDVPGRFVGLWPELIIEEAELTMRPGDTLVCYSDGVPDAENAVGEKYGLDRLLAVVGAKGHLSAGEVASHITASIDQFRGETPEPDDITILVTKSTG